MITFFIFLFLKRLVVKRDATSLLILLSNKPYIKDQPIGNFSIKKLLIFWDSSPIIGVEYFNKSIANISKFGSCFLK